MVFFLRPSRMLVAGPAIELSPRPAFMRAEDDNTLYSLCRAVSQKSFVNLGKLLNIKDEMVSKGIGRATVCNMISNTVMSPGKIFPLFLKIKVLKK